MFFAKIFSCCFIALAQGFSHSTIVNRVARSKSMRNLEMVATEKIPIVSQRYRSPVTDYSTLTTIISDQTFENEVLSQDGLSLVFFTAPWCGPCKVMKSIIDETAKDTFNILKVMEVNTDNNPISCMEFQIRSIPSCIIFKDGEVVADIVGTVSKDVLIKQALKFYQR